MFRFLLGAVRLLAFPFRYAPRRSAQNMPGSVKFPYFMEIPAGIPFDFLLPFFLSGKKKGG
jgi:hypothetical protein